jgi:hypothetical protein
MMMPLPFPLAENIPAEFSGRQPIWEAGLDLGKQRLLCEAGFGY